LGGRRLGLCCLGPVPCLANIRVGLVLARRLLHQPKHGTAGVPGWPEPILLRAVPVTGQFCVVPRVAQSARSGWTCKAPEGDQREDGAREDVAGLPGPSAPPVARHPVSLHHHPKSRRPTPGSTGPVCVCPSSTRSSNPKRFVGPPWFFTNRTTNGRPGFRYLSDDWSADT
jgi:hypothetical protein